MLAWWWLNGFHSTLLLILAFAAGLIKKPMLFSRILVINTFIKWLIWSSIPLISFISQASSIHSFMITFFCFFLLFVPLSVLPPLFSYSFFVYLSIASLRALFSLLATPLLFSHSFNSPSRLCSLSSSLMERMMSQSLHLSLSLPLALTEEQEG